MEIVALLIENLSEFLSCSEPALRLILSVFMGYPCALVYRWFLFHQPAKIIHLFHALSGLALAAFNFGEIAERSAS